METEGMKNEIAALLPASNEKSENVKQLMVNRMTVHRVEKRLGESETSKDRLRVDRSRLVKTAVIIKAFEYETTIKIKHHEKKKQIPMSTVSKTW